jgi:hypothetical protein
VWLGGASIISKNERMAKFLKQEISGGFEAKKGRPGKGGLFG